MKAPICVVLLNGVLELRGEALGGAVARALGDHVRIELRENKFDKARFLRLRVSGYVKRLR